MIDFYTYGTINGQAVAITLELLKVPYRTHMIDLTRDEQRQPAFLKINPSGRIPVIIDEVDNKPIILSQTAAILIYLAEKSDQLLIKDTAQRYKTLQWMHFVLTDIGTNVFNNFHLKALVTPKQPAAGEMLKQRAIKFCDEIEQQLSQQTYVAGDQLSLADVVAFPVVRYLQEALLNEQLPNLSRWYKGFSQHPAVVKGMKTGC